MIRNLSKNLINYKTEELKSEFLSIVERESLLIGNLNKIITRELNLN